MDTKLPVEIEEFAREYFAAESRATMNSIGKCTFRKVDQKAIALRFKAVMDLPIVESIDQLCQDLAAFRPDSVGAYGHKSRLAAFVKRNKVKVASRQGQHFRTPRTAGAVPFNFKASMQQNINKALQAGVSLRLVREESAQVLEELNQRVQRQDVEPRIHAILQETGMTKAEFASIVNAI